MDAVSDLLVQFGFLLVTFPGRDLLWAVGNAMDQMFETPQEVYVEALIHNTLVVG